MTYEDHAIEFINRNGGKSVIDCMVDFANERVEKETIDLQARLDKVEGAFRELLKYSGEQKPGFGPRSIIAKTFLEMAGLSFKPVGDAEEGE